MTLALAAVFVSGNARAQAAPSATPASTPVIVDTDSGTDDLLALAFLLARSDVHIEAITVVNGVAHVPAGTANVLALLQLAGRADIPVYLGSANPLSGNAAFPAAWRRSADALPGVDLPMSHGEPESESAEAFFLRRLADAQRPVRILALGPLTNLGAVLRREPSAVRAIEELVVMGGAIRVPGNLGDGGAFSTHNKTAEWNIYVDPLAASIVFDSKVPIRLIPLDATRQVPIGADFVNALNAGAKTPLKHFAAQILAGDATLIEQGILFAWDPLAAVTLVDPGVVRTTPMSIHIRMSGNQRGRTVDVKNSNAPNARVAISADAALFQREFLAALSAPASE